MEVNFRSRHAGAMGTANYVTETVIEDNGIAEV